jgi:thiol-disulfide isomerase/thioredoxin
MKPLLLALLFLLPVTGTFAQTAAKNDPPYKKYPTLPAFPIVLPDSSAAINTYDIPEGHTTVLLLFSPDCHHCRDMVPKLLQKVDSFPQVRFYLITLMGLQSLRDFIQEFNVLSHENVLAGKDPNHFFPGFYKISYIPHAVIYDRHKKLVEVVDGNFDAEVLLDVVRKSEAKKK